MAEVEKKKKKKKEKSESIVHQPLEAEEVPEGEVEISEYGREISSVYSVQGIPLTLLSGDLRKITIHVDIQPNFAGNGSARQLPTGHNNPTVKEIVFPEKGEAPVRLVCIGCKRWSVKGDVSIGVDIGDVPKTVTMNSSTHVFTLMSNHQSSYPEPLFSVKPDSVIHQMFPSMTEASIDKGYGPAHTSGGGQMVAVSVDLDPKTRYPLCPVGFLLKRDLDLSHTPYELVKYGSSSCIEITHTKFLEMAADFKAQIRDNRVLFSKAKGDRLVFTPSNPSVFYASMILDIYYCKI